MTVLDVEVDKECYRSQMVLDVSDVFQKLIRGWCLTHKVNNISSKLTNQSFVLKGSPTFFLG